MRIGVASDLHIGGGADYGREPGDRLADQRRVWRAACELFVSQRCEIVLFAGDAFERRRPTPAEILVFLEGLDVLAASRIPLVGVRGNHDVEAFDRPAALDLGERVRETRISRTPEIIEHAGAVAIATLPWAPSSYFVARSELERDDAHAAIADRLVEAARGLRARVADELPGIPSILLLHWSVGGATTSTGASSSDFREPVLSRLELEQLDFDFTVCGHIHKPQILSPKNWELEGDAEHFTDNLEQLTGRPFVFYAGSTWTCNFGEAAHPHGVWVLTVGDEGKTATYHELEDRPFVTIDRELIEIPGVGVTFSEPAGDVTDAVVRVRYSGTEALARAFDVAQAKRDLYMAGAHRVYSIAPGEIVRAARVRIEADETLAPLEAFDRWLATQEGITAPPDELAARTHDYLRRAEA